MIMKFEEERVMKLGPISAARLLQHARFMDELPVEAERCFNMGSYFGGTYPAPSTLRSPGDLLHWCGTTACALGWAVVNPECNLSGLFLSAAGTILFDPSGTYRANGTVMSGDDERRFDQADNYFFIDTPGDRPELSDMPLEEWPSKAVAHRRLKFWRELNDYAVKERGKVGTLGEFRVTKEEGK
jgi:hypothetical protein